MRSLPRRSLLALTAGLALLPLPAAAAPPGVIGAVRGSGYWAQSGITEWGGELIDTGHARFNLRARFFEGGSAEGDFAFRMEVAPWLWLRSNVVAGNFIGTDQARLFCDGSVRFANGPWQPLGQGYIDVWEHAFSGTPLPHQIVIDFTGAGVVRRLEGRARHLIVTPPFPA